MATVADDQAGGGDGPLGEAALVGALRAQALLDAGRPAAARDAAARLLAAHPDDAGALVLLGRAELALGGFASAAAWGQQAAAADPEGAEGSDGEAGLLLAACAWTAAGRRPEAVAAAVRATRCAPGSWRAWAQLAVSGAAGGRAGAGARAAARRAVRLAPQEPEAHLALAVALRPTLPWRARPALAAALRLDPQHPVAHVDLGLVELARVVVLLPLRPAPALRALAHFLAAADVTTVGPVRGAALAGARRSVRAVLQALTWQLVLCAGFLIGQARDSAGQARAVPGWVAAAALGILAVGTGRAGWHLWRLPPRTRRAVGAGLRRRGVTPWAVAIALGWVLVAAGLVTALVAALLGTPGRRDAAPAVLGAAAGPTVVAAAFALAHLARSVAHRLRPDTVGDTP